MSIKDKLRSELRFLMMLLVVAVVTVVFLLVIMDKMIKPIEVEYIRATALMDYGHYYEAAQVLEPLALENHYKDSEKKLSQCIEAMGHEQREVYRSETQL